MFFMRNSHEVSFMTYVNAMIYRYNIKYFVFQLKIFKFYLEFKKNLKIIFLKF